MANKEHLKLLKQGTEVWNQWREEHPDIRPDLGGANLAQANLEGANLFGANLFGASLIEANLIGANLIRANLTGPSLDGANLARANLTRANLIEANLIGANLDRTNLTGAILLRTTLDQASLREAIIGWAIFGYVDLSPVEGLDTVYHCGPSTIGIDTLYCSNGKIPEVFLLGCGVQPELITCLEKIKTPKSPYTKEQLDEWIDNLQERLTIFNKRLAHYKLQAAKYGTLDVPFSIIQEIDSTEEEIQKAELERAKWQQLKDVYY